MFAVDGKADEIVQLVVQDVQTGMKFDQAGHQISRPRNIPVRNVKGGPMLLQQQRNPIKRGESYRGPVNLKIERKRWPDAPTAITA